MDSPTSGRRPNLLYLHSDQHNPFVTGCYGDPVVETRTWTDWRAAA